MKVQLVQFQFLCSLVPAPDPIVLYVSYVSCPFCQERPSDDSKSDCFSPLDNQLKSFVNYIILLSEVVALFLLDTPLAYARLKGECTLTRITNNNPILLCLTVDAVFHPRTHLVHFLCRARTFPSPTGGFSDPVLVFLYFTLFFMASLSFCFLVSGKYTKSHHHILHSLELLLLAWRGHCRGLDR